MEDVGPILRDLLSNIPYCQLMKCIRLNFCPPQPKQKIVYIEVV